jgi:hypothetical protein
MEIAKIALEFNLADLVAQNEINVSATITLAQPQFKPPPPPNPFMERLRKEFKKIEHRLANQSLEIMLLLLDTQWGQTSRDELIESIWTHSIPTFDRVRNAICVLNRQLDDLQFGYVVKGSRRGIIKIEIR